MGCAMSRKCRRRTRATLSLLSSDDEDDDDDHHENVKLMRQQQRYYNSDGEFIPSPLMSKRSPPSRTIKHKNADCQYSVL